MQEIVLILSSLAGVATAAAVRKIPKNKKQIPNINANSHIKSQINSLKIEKNILTKTILRLYQTDSEYSKTQRDKLVLKYQHQLGIVLAKLEKLEQASKHPDLGPVGDGLITLMDQRLSKLDDRLEKLSSEITSTKIETPRPKEAEIRKEKEPEIRKEKEPEIRKEKESKPQIVKPMPDTLNRFEKQKESKLIITPTITKSRPSFELSTLTSISRKESKFSPFRKEESKPQIVKPMPEPRKIQSETTRPKVEDKIEIIQSVTPKPKLEIKTDINKEAAKIIEHKALPEPQQNPKPTTLDEDFDDDGDDLDKIKGDIMKVLSKLDQAEVE